MSIVYPEIDLGFLQEANWPRLPAATSEVGKNHHSWLVKMSNCMSYLLQRIDNLETENKNQKTSIDTLKALVYSYKTREHTSQKSPVPPLDWKKIASGMVHKVDNAVAIMATIASEMKKKEERVNNITASIPIRLF
ncbi:hypothetical protein BpHYR1_034228 [Brachionus plicatilis]|uniref:Uncharacterized protein n=1 Tax=Brachionus plicatilis TaxID=10195 RepID=A0A3M7R541_BRAPC|nr:hypothetical protein BpHYR1_034228 [Brachionus plicatilis]